MKLEDVDQNTARAWAEAEIIPVQVYARMAMRNGWKTQMCDSTRTATGVPVLSPAHRRISVCRPV